MNYDIISTGSKGNAVILQRRILVDCGVSFSKLREYAKELSVVLLTHRHSDHFKPATVRALHRERPALRWGCCSWMVQPLLDAGVSKRMVDVFTPGQAYLYDIRAGSCTVQAEAIPHNVPNCCFKLHFSDAGSVFYATDCATLDGIRAEHFDLYMVEANHTKADIEARIAEKLSQGEYSYELEAARNHLSQEQALDWLAENAGPHSEYLFLHQHQESLREVRHGA